MIKVLVLIIIPYNILAGLYLIRMHNHLSNIITGQYTKVLIIAYILLLIATLIWFKFFKQTYRLKTILLTALIGLMIAVVPPLIAKYNFSYPATPFIEIITSWQVAITYLGFLLGFMIGPIFNKVHYRKSHEKYFVFMLFLVSFCLYAGLAIYKQNSFQTPAWDTGIFDQAIWNLSRFHAPASTIRGYSNLWADHFHPIMLLFVPLVWIYNSQLAISVGEIFFICLAIFPAYSLAKGVLGSRKIALGLSASYVFYGGLQYGLNFGYHPEIMVAPLIIFMVYFLSKSKHLWMYLFLILALATKEDAGLSIFVLGLAISINKKWRREGLIIAFVSILWSVLAIKIVIPYFNGTAHYQYWDYNSFGKSPGDLIKAILSKPLFTLRYIFSDPQKVNTLLHSYGDFGFLPAGSLGFIITLPYLFENLLSSRVLLWSYQFHYYAMLAPYLFLASVYSLKKIKMKQILYPMSYLGYSLILIVISTNLIYTYPLYNYLTQGNEVQNTFNTNQTYKKALAKIPPTASVSAPDTIAAHLAHRSKIYMYPTVNNSQYLVLSSQVSSFPLSRSDIVKDIKSYKNNPEWKMIYNSEKIIVFEKLSK